MIIGDKSKFAIESGITEAYERLSWIALGFFLIHIQGYAYGVREPDATMLACSFNEVRERVARRGTHIAAFAEDTDAGRIADAIRKALYTPGQENEHFFGISQLELRTLIRGNHLIWAPDGDEAFDDGSFVMQFDVGNRVRLIGFKSSEEGYDSSSLRDVWLGVDEFYGVLTEWSKAFESHWATIPKVHENQQFSGFVIGV